jgi:lysophospholipase L1-like esterase
VSRGAAGKLAAVLFGVALFCGVAELGARLVFRELVRYDVEMWRYAREVKDWGRTPGLRFEHRPGVVTKLMGVEVRTNAFGMRDREVPERAAPGTLRIAAVGDSITFGWGVPAAETFPEVLERELGAAGVADRVEVLNFGVGNYNTADELALLRLRVLEFHPDVVLLGVYLNDAEEGRARPPGAGLLRHSLFAAWAWGRVDALLRITGVREGFAEYYRGLHRPGSPGREGMERALEGIFETCRREGIPVVVALLPELHQLARYPFADVHAWIRSEAERAGARVVDLREALPATGDPARFWVSPDDPHPNADAHARYGALLARVFTEEMAGRAGTEARGESP